MIFTVLISAILCFIILQMLYTKVISKPVAIVDHERFIIEVNERKRHKHQVLVVFSNGYWEIKEEHRSDEWSAERGSETYIDLDTDIDDVRYFKAMGEPLARDESGKFDLKIRKEIDLNPAFNPYKSLKI